MQEGGYFSFHKMISTDVVKAVYVIGFIFITLAGLGGLAFSIYQIAAVDEAPQATALLQIGVSLIVLLVGHILWRMLCESVILFFSMHDLIASIAKRQADGGEVDLTYIARQIHALDKNADVRHQEAIRVMGSARLPVYTEGTKR